MPEDKNPVTGRRTNPASDRSQNISGNSNPATEKRGSVAQNFQNPTSAQVPAAGNDQQRANMQDAQNDFASQFRDAANAPEKTRSYGDIAKEMLGMGGSEADNSPSSLQQSITNLTDNHQQMMQSPQGSTSGQAAQRPPGGNDQQIGNIQDALNDFAGQFRDTANAPEKTWSYGDIARGMLGVGGSKADNSPSSLQQSITNVTDKHQQMMQSQQRSPASQNRGKIADAVKKSGNPGDP